MNHLEIIEIPEVKLNINHIIPVLKETNLVIVKCDDINYIQNLARVQNYVCKIPHILLNKSL